MPAELLLWERHQLTADSFAEIKIWRVPAVVPGSWHGFKYSLAYIVAGECVLRYDNEAGEGDHRHFGAREEPYRFADPEGLLAHFWADVDRWRQA